MMKKNSKLKSSISLVLTFALLLPMGVLAAETGDSTETGVNAQQVGDVRSIDTTGGVFCNNVDKWTDIIETRFVDRENALIEKLQERDNNIINRRAERDADLENKRNGWDDNRMKRYADLEARAETVEQEGAVAKFKKTIEAAVSERRAAIDESIDVFRRESTELVASRRQLVGVAVDDFKDAVFAAGTKAKEGCSSGITAITVRQNYHDSLKAASDKFQADRQTIDTIEDQMQVLVQNRLTAAEQAVNDFKDILQAAAEELKVSFGGEL